AERFSTKFRKLLLEQQVEHDRGLYGDGLYLAKSMANWKWRFGNCDLFVVDNGIYVGLTMIAVSSMTFIIQLELSETNVRII
ncbi:unnamed protein product, partial [Allacma fusca]